MPEANLSTMGGRVSHLATLAGLSLYDLSEAVGLSRSTLYAVATGAGSINGKTLRALSEKTSAREGWISAGEGKPPSAEAVRKALGPVVAKSRGARA